MYSVIGLQTLGPCNTMGRPRENLECVVSTVVLTGLRVLGRRARIAG